MAGVPAELSDPLLRMGPRLGPMAGRLLWYPEITSTNDAAARLAEHGAAEGTIVAADGQTMGRGRLGRAWASPPGAGIYVSVILRPESSVAPLITIAAGVALSEGIAAATGLQTQVKWPNDLYAGGRKLAGILAEGVAAHVVLGFGVNVSPGAFPADVAARATSIEGELGRPADRGLVLAESLAALWRRYVDLGCGRVDRVLAAWRARAAATLGRPIEWQHDGAIRRGVARDIDAGGALLVESSAGPERVLAGAVRWL